MVRILACVLLVVVLAALPAAGQTLTLAEFLESALASHPDVERSALALQAAEANLASVNSEPQLALSINLGYYSVPVLHRVQGGLAASLGAASQYGSKYSLTVDLTSKTFQFQLMHPLFTPEIVLPHRQETAARTYACAAARIAHQMVLEEVFHEAAQCFLNIWRLEKEGEIRRDLIAWLAAQLDITAAAHVSGIASELDLAVIKLQYEQQVNALDRIQGELAVERMLAVQLYGMQPGMRLIHNPAEFSTSMLERILPFHSAHATALAELSYDWAKARMEIVRAAGGIEGELRLNIYSDRSWSVECSFRVPLFHQAHRKQQLEAASAELAQAAVEMERAELEIGCEQIYQQVNLHTAANKRKTAAAAWDLAICQRQIAEEQHALGMLSFLDLLKVCEEEANAHLAVVNAEYEHQLALIRQWLLSRSWNND